MKQYEHYKDSGYWWIGRIPSHWGTIRIKHYCHQIISGATPNTSESGYWDGDIPWIPSGECHDCTIDSAPKYITKVGLKSCSTRVIPANTTLIAMTGATCSKVGFLSIDACTNQSVTSFIINNKKANSKFLFYLLIGIREYVLTHQTGGAQGGIDGGDCRNLIIPDVPLLEQVSIVHFLDAECAKIDGIIAKYEKRVSLLQEMRLVVISSSITKGVNEGVEMKPSGIDWLGDIPSDWTLWKTSYLFKGIGSGTTPSSSDPSYYDDDGYNWLQTGDLNDGLITSTSKKVTDKAVKEKNLKFYPIDSLVIAMYGATIGKVGILGIETSTNQACCVLPPSKKVLPEFAYYHFLAAKTALINQASGGGQPNISQDIIRRHKMAIPPTLDEQQQIVTKIKESIATYDAAIVKTNRQIDLLREYKQSLITEVVTGKLKVC